MCTNSAKPRLVRAITLPERLTPVPRLTSSFDAPRGKLSEVLTWCLCAPSRCLNPAFSTKNVDLCTGARSIFRCFRLCSKGARRRDQTGHFRFRDACLSSGSSVRDFLTRVKSVLQDAA